MKRIALSLVLLLTALPASAQELSQRAASLLDLIIENDCAMTKAEAATALPAAGFTRREYRGLMKELKDASAVTLSEGTATVVVGVCASSAPILVPLQEQYLAILRHNGCQRRSDEAGSLFPRFGLEANVATELEEGLVDSGIAVFADGALRIGPEYCIAVEDFPTLPFLELTSDEQHLVEILETGSCTVVQSQIDVSFPQDGMQPAAARAAVESLLASGAAQAVTSGDRVWLSPEICRPWSERRS